MSIKRFRIALSFAGEKRGFVAKIANLLAERFGEDKILYDNFHEAEFAHANLAFALPDLYRDEADLIVAVFCSDYDHKEWCGLEWRAIFALIKQGVEQSVMLTRFDHADGKGLHGLAGFIELDDKTPEQTTVLILERLAINEGKAKEYYTKPASIDAAVLQTDIPNNLPSLQPFFGREKELAEIRAALDPESRTWGTLIDGDGGMGKTSLAIRAAYDVPAANFRKIIFVSVKQRVLYDDKERNLGEFALSSWLEMLNEIARELGQGDITKASENERARLVQGALRGRQVLLVLDNLETLTKPEQDQLFTFLEYLPSGCKALLTSRIFVGNKVLAIELSELDQFSALRLLEEIAKHNVSFEKSTEAERIDLYQEIGGRPLLLRWVAGQVGETGCTSISDALSRLSSCPAGNDPLSFIFGDILADLCPEDLLILSTLTHPSLPISVESISEICGVALQRTRISLKCLSTRPLVISDQSEQNYSLVPMVAEFIRHVRSDIVLQMGNQLADRASRLIDENGHSNHARFSVIEANWPSIVPAFPVFLAGDNARLQAVCDALVDFLDFTGRWDECLFLETEAEVKAVASSDYFSAGWRAYSAGYIHYQRQHIDGVFHCAKRVLSHWNAIQVGARDFAYAIRLGGFGYRLDKDYPASINAFREALELLRNADSGSEDVASLLNDLAGVETLFGNFESAENNFLEAIRIAHANGYEEGVALYMANSANLALERRDWGVAEKLSRDALVLAEEVGRQELIACVCQWLAQALMWQEKSAESLPYARRAVEIFNQLGSPRRNEACNVLAECEAAL